MRARRPSARWLVENGEVEHLSITIGPTSRLRTVVTSVVDCIEVGLPDSLNVSLAQAMVEFLTQDGVGDESGELFLGSLCEALVRHFARVHRTRYRSTRLGTAPADDITSRAIAAIESRFAEPLAVNALAAEAGLSSAYFSAVFKRETGLSPHQYLLQVRIERVREALKSTDLAVAEIALNFGFSSQSHLNAAFRRLLGITPGQYRNHKK
jgi:AraC family transcriptional regulator